MLLITKISKRNKGAAAKVLQGKISNLTTKHVSSRDAGNGDGDPSQGVKLKDDNKGEGTGVASVLAGGWVVALVEPTPVGEIAMAAATSVLVLVYGPQIVTDVQTRVADAFGNDSYPGPWSTDRPNNYIPNPPLDQVIIIFLMELKELLEEFCFINFIKSGNKQFLNQYKLILLIIRTFTSKRHQTINN